MHKTKTIFCVTKNQTVRFCLEWQAKRDLINRLSCIRQRTLYCLYKMHSLFIYVICKTECLISILHNLQVRLWITLVLTYIQIRPILFNIKQFDNLIDPKSSQAKMFKIWSIIKPLDGKIALVMTLYYVMHIVRW